MMSIRVQLLRACTSERVAIETLQGEVVQERRDARFETPINAAQKVIGWDVIFKVERVKQPFLPTR
ncbi:hypothetical protein JFT92_24185 [Pseudomonas sp. TH35]|uniref:hypothetical protein n=1 Tax=Gammaproteobacteria TaxID=1236 RepID=UPI001912C0F2|nr:hypothetical protein [Bacillus sp. TH86]MBK5313076.1 hypothetical protein [Pseudomonas sp. TH71]MBK5318573.1 hypothetical protein [Erwinia sp. TH79]MBK5324075.1 hypothetical protein [Bacillus sp. TH59]MBK5339025.1 hypothetical protein [Bacillus sp. TH57]MBK5372280.1 hypothetical protein [Pseudomonas sp. TH40]MBK5383449.1 hypothetical protein [Pseudomonas sp. TH35]MBK5388908.1 hypothetical protein [Pseudomonas sp. TH38]MBK5406203.1 hypothetical protein [Pseudomonas sp. TH37]MBK5423433.1 